LLAFCGITFAADEHQSLVLRAQSDFDRVYLSGKPLLTDAQSCAQSQAALLPVAAPEELSLIHFRSGYCTLVSSLITRERGSFADAERAFRQAAATWPTLIKGKNQVAQPVSSGVRVLAAMAVLEGAPDAAALPELDRQLASALEKPSCAAGVVPERLCRDLLAAAGQWRGWIAVRQNRLEDAGGLLDPALWPGWSAWVSGRRAFDRRDFQTAVAGYGKAVADWSARETSPPTSIPSGVHPRPNLASALADLGGAQLLTGDYRAALRSLDAAVKRDPSSAWPLFLRARAKEAAGQRDAALADYNLASRTAFAEAGENAAGEAHFYRGLWLFRRNDRARAEDEFASALNFAVAPRLRPDVMAWRNLMAVIGGACGASRASLEQALPAVSPFFPKDEATAAAALCASSDTASAAGNSLR